MPKKSQPELLTIPQAAEFLESSRQAVWSAIKKNRLPVAARYGHVTLIPRTALAEYKKNRRRGGPPSKRKSPKA